MTNVEIFGTHEPNTLEQLRDVASRAERAALMADGHLGYVMPIGGVKEKVLAAHRAGVKNIVLLKDNEKDLADIPKNVLDTLNVFMVQTMDEVLKIALAEPLAGRLPETQAEPVDSAIIDDTITH